MSVTEHILPECFVCQTDHQLSTILERNDSMDTNNEEEADDELSESQVPIH